MHDQWLTCKYLLPIRMCRTRKNKITRFWFSSGSSRLRVLDSLVLFEFCAFFGIRVLIQLGSFQNMGSSWLRSVLFSSCEETLIWSSTTHVLQGWEYIMTVGALTLRCFSICCCCYHYYLNRLCLAAPAYCSGDNSRLGQISSCHLAIIIIIYPLIKCGQNA